MATHDYNIANQTALNFRGDLNDALEAIVSTNSNATAPTTTYQYMWWYDTTNDLLKMRDSSNSAWITIGYIDQSNLNFQPYIGGTQVTEVLDEDDMASDSPTAIPSQQSVKSYVDNSQTPRVSTIADGSVERIKFTEEETTSLYNNYATIWRFPPLLSQGSLSFSVQLKGASGTTSFRIFKNGSAVETFSTSSTTYSTKTYVDSSVSAGDQFTFGMKISSVSGTAYARNLTMYTDSSEIPLFMPSTFSGATVDMS